MVRRGTRRQDVMARRVTAPCSTKNSQNNLSESFEDSGRDLGPVRFLMGRRSSKREWPRHCFPCRSIAQLGTRIHIEQRSTDTSHLGPKPWPRCGSPTVFGRPQQAGSRRSWSDTICASRATRGWIRWLGSTVNGMAILVPWSPCPQGRGGRQALGHSAASGRSNGRGTAHPPLGFETTCRCPRDQVSPSSKEKAKNWRTGRGPLGADKPNKNPTGGWPDQLDIGTLHQTALTIHS